MTAFDRRVVCCSAALLCAVAVAVAQDRATPAAAANPNMNDPRVGLKAGFHDAGQAARNMELVASLGKPEGFFDPAAPAGDAWPMRGSGPGAAPPAVVPPPASAASPGGAASSSTSSVGAAAAGARGTGRGGAGRTGAGAGRGGSGLNFANSDIAFHRADLFLGNFNGFNAYDIETPRKTRLLSSVVCPGGQGDMSVYGHLLFMSVEQTRGRVDCGTEGVTETVSAERFRGVRIFDISDIQHPRQVAAIQTCRGSHTHTLVTDPKDPDDIYVYGSGTAGVRPGDELAGCSSKDPNEDPNTALFSIDVIKVPLAAPEKAALVNRPRIFADEKTGRIAGLEPGGDRGPGAQPSRPTNQCHDITAYPEIGLAAGACAGNGILLDISDPVHPVRLDAVTDRNFAYWHSATFNNDGTKVVFTDEWGGGTAPRCRASDPINWGADAIFDIVDKKLVFRSYFKMPAPQTDQENCVAHNGSIVPVPGRDIMVQGWYQGGVSVFDFTDSARPVEIAFFDRGPIDANALVIGGFWSAYWYNGRIYGSEIARGLDIFRLLPSEYLSQNEIDAASLVRLDELNVQKQPKIVWPASFVVSRAYLDQLNRTHTLPADRAAALKSAISKADKSKPSRSAIDRLNGLATELEKDATAAHGVDASRMTALAESIKAKTAKLGS